MLNLKSIKLLTKTELNLWFYSFIFLSLSFSPLIFNFIWGNHDWNPVLNGNSLHSGLIEGRITQFLFLNFLLDGHIFPILNICLGFLAYTLSIVILTTRFFEFEASYLKTSIIIILISTLSYINEIIYFQFIIFSQLIWPLIITLSLLCYKKAVSSNTILYTILSTILLYTSIAGYPASANLFVTAISLYLIQQYNTHSSIKLIFKQSIPFIIILSISFFLLIISYEYLRNQNVMMDKYNTSTSSLIEIIQKLPTIFILSIKSLLQPQPFFSIAYKLLSSIFCLGFGYIYIYNHKNKKDMAIRILLILAVFISIKFSALLTSENNDSYFPKHDPIAYMVRADFYSIPCFILFCLFYILKTTPKSIQNITILLSTFLIFININQNLNYSKVQLLGFNSEINLLNRITSRIENSFAFNPKNFYTVVQTGDIPLRSRYYTPQPFEKYGFYNLQVALVRHWLPHEFYNFYHPSNFVLSNSAINPHELTRQMVLFLSQKVKTWPSHTSTFVNNKYAVIALSDEGRKMLQEQFKNLIKRK